jgi:hypothetical protein
MPREDGPAHPADTSRTKRGTGWKADPGQKQDWFLRCLQGGRAHPLAAWGFSSLVSTPLATLAQPPTLVPPVSLTPLVLLPQ